MHRCFFFMMLCLGLYLGPLSGESAEGAKAPKEKDLHETGMLAAESSLVSASTLFGARSLVSGTSIIRSAASRQGDLEKIKAAALYRKEAFKERKTDERRKLNEHALGSNKRRKQRLLNLESRAHDLKLELEIARNKNIEMSGVIKDPETPKRKVKDFKKLIAREKVRIQRLETEMSKLQKSLLDLSLLPGPLKKSSSLKKGADHLALMSRAKDLRDSQAFKGKGAYLKYRKLVIKRTLGHGLGALAALGGYLSLSHEAQEPLASDDSSRVLSRLEQESSSGQVNENNNFMGR